MSLHHHLWDTIEIHGKIAVFQVDSNIFLVSVVFATANLDPDYLVRIHMLCNGKCTLNFTTDEAAVDC